MKLDPAQFANMDRQDAAEMFAAIDRARFRLTAAVRKIGNTRAPASAKADAVAPLRADLATFEALAAAIGAAHNLGGY